jgi:hypothetical protein
MTEHYILQGKMVVMEPNLRAWARWYETADRVVAKDYVDDILISTVFLGLDHNLQGHGDPLLFETLVFLAEGETGDMQRYFTWAEAECGHALVLESIRDFHSHTEKLTLNALRAILKPAL